MESSSVQLDISHISNTSGGLESERGRNRKSNITDLLCDLYGLWDGGPSILAGKWPRSRPI